MADPDPLAFDTEIRVTATLGDTTEAGSIINQHFSVYAPEAGIFF
jgi:hypothetical protein